MWDLLQPECGVDSRGRDRGEKESEHLHLDMKEREGVD